MMEATETGRKKRDGVREDEDMCRAVMDGGEDEEETQTDKKENRGGEKKCPPG